LTRRDLFWFYLGAFEVLLIFIVVAFFGGAL
jgi:hypothetical protein